VGLFGNKQKNAEQFEAGQVEVDRLTALAPNELAEELLPAFGADGARSKGREGTPPMQIVQWLVRSHPFHPSLQPLVSAVLAGLQALEHAGLVDRRASGTGTSGMRFLLTPLGEQTLADGSAHERLAPGA
jgi:hypothetical protein